MPIEKLKRDTTIAVTVRPKTDFDKEGMNGAFRTKDVGEPGGMKLTIGKLKSDIKEVPTKTQRVLVSKGDFDIVRGDLVPTTAQGERELRHIQSTHGRLYHAGGDYFAPRSEKERFDKLKYFKNPKGGKRNMPRYKKGISPQEISGARRRGVPEPIISKMTRSQEITQRERDVLNSKGLGYKVTFRKDDGTWVRSHTFALKGGKRGSGGGSHNPGRSPIEVKPSLPRGAYS